MKTYPPSSTELEEMNFMEIMNENFLKIDEYTGITYNKEGYWYISFQELRRVFNPTCQDDILTLIQLFSPNEK